MGTYNHQAQAQPAPHLTIDALINFPDTAFYGQAYPIAIRVKNIGAVPYQGPLQIGLMADSAFAYLFYSNNPTNVILPNDTITLYTTGSGMLGFVFDSSVFRLGNNVVVVWPYSSQGSVLVDSLVTDVYINSTTGVKSISADDNFRLYPNPFKDNIMFDGVNKFDIDRVRIFTLQGVKVYDEKPLTKPIDLNRLNSGCYLMEAKLKNGQRFYRKIIKE